MTPIKEGTDYPYKSFIEQSEEKKIERLDIYNRELEASFQQRRLLNIVYLVIFSTSLAATLVILFLQGFHVGGFNLDSQVLLLIGTGTIGSIAGLIRAAFVNAKTGEDEKQFQETARDLKS